jgi:site-specific DNA-methyltransferase (adenine-specific)
MESENIEKREPISLVTNEDCMELMSRYPDKYFELAIVDPPYGININTSMGRRKGDKKSSYHKFAGNDSNIPSFKFFLELFRVSTNQIIWGGNYMTEHLPPSPCWLLWDKGFSSDVTFAQFELAWSSFKTSAKKYDYNAAKNLNRIHPTQKPVKLYEWLLKNYASEGDKILDTHLGSGSSRIAADKMGFDFYACELDRDYFEAQEKRFKEYKSQLKLF